MPSTSDWDFPYKNQITIEQLLQHSAGVYDVSVVSMIPLWDVRAGTTSFLKCFNAIYDAAYAARSALGFPGKP